MQNNLQSRLDLITEAPLSPERAQLVDAIIARLEELKSRDFGPGGDAGKSHFINYLASASQKIANAANYGRTQERLRNMETAAALDKARQKQFSDLSNKMKNILTQFAEQYPRLITVAKDSFSFVQPSGQLVTLGFSPTVNKYFVPLIYAVRKLYRNGVYEELNKKVQSIRDFGLNISSKQLSTEYSTFRTGYAVISELVLSYQGPMVTNRGVPILGFESMREISDASNIGINNVNVPGRCYVAVLGSPIPKLTVRNVELSHLGEMIDTIDIVCHTISEFADLTGINCMGEDVVEYVIRKSVNNGVERQVAISSEQVTSPKELGRLLISKIRAG